MKPPKIHAKAYHAPSQYSRVLHTEPHGQAKKRVKLIAGLSSVSQRSCLKLKVTLMIIATILKVSIQRCTILNLPQVEYNATLEDHQVLDLSSLAGNYNFSLNFALRYIPARFPDPGANPMLRYNIADIDGILRVYLEFYAGEPRLNFFLLADLEPATNIKSFDLTSDSNILVTVMRNNRVNWGYHVYYIHNNTDFREDLTGKPESSFIQGSKLVIGGDQTKGRNSFPGNIGPLHFSNSDTFELPDPKLHMSAFHRAKFSILFRLVPYDITGETSFDNLAFLRAEDKTLSSTVQLLDGSEFTPSGDLIFGNCFIDADNVLIHKPATANGKYNGLELEQFRESEVITFGINLILEN